MASSPAPSDISSIPSEDSIQRPPCLTCKDCSVEYYDTNLGDGKITIQLQLCSLHKTSFMAPSINPILDNRPGSPAPARLPSLLLSPSPVSAPTYPNAQQAMVASRRGGASASDNMRNIISQPISPTRSPSSSRAGGSSTPTRSRRSRSRSPRRQIPTPPTNRSYPRSSVPATALHMYEDVRRDVLHRNNPKSTRQSLRDRKISDRTWQRKRKIAELMIIDKDRFDTLVSNNCRDGNTDRLNQQTLADDCGKILRRAEYVSKRRAALAAGKLI